MTRRALLALGCLIGLSLAGLTACQARARVGESSPAWTTSTPLPTTFARSTPTPPPSTAVPAGEIPGFSAFTPASGRYRIAYPAGWIAQEGGVKVGSFAADVFVSPKPDDGFAANVNVLCQPLAVPISSQEFRGATIDYLRSQAAIEPTDGEQMMVAGEPVSEVDYDAALLGKSYEVTQLVIARGDCGWVLTLSTARGHRADYRPIFVTMAGSFAPAR